MLSRSARVCIRGLGELRQGLGAGIPPWSSWVWNRHPRKSRYRFRELVGYDPAALGVNLAAGEEDAFGVTSLLYTLCALTVWYLLKLLYVLLALAVTPLSLNLLASSFLGTGLCNPTPFKQLPWANWHLIATAWGAYCVYLCGRLRHLLPTFFVFLVLVALMASRKVAVTFLGTVAVGPLQLDASSAACPSAAGSPLLALTLHLLYLTLADWCTEKVSEHAEMNKPSSELPLLPRLHQSIVMATQPWWELLPVSWALRLQMSRIWVGLKTVWLLASAALVWCLSLRKRWRSAVLVASAGAWLYSGQKDLGEISWSAGQAAVALCVWSVTTFWGLVFTPVALAIVGLMYWDEIEVRMRQWRQSVARVVRWRQRRSASSKEAKATKAATFKTSNKAKRTDKQSPVSAPSASVSAGTADGSRAAVSSNLPAKVAVATLPAVKQRGGNKAGVGVIPKNKASAATKGGPIDPSLSALDSPRAAGGGGGLVGLLLRLVGLSAVPRKPHAPADVELEAKAKALAAAEAAAVKAARSTSGMSDKKDSLGDFGEFATDAIRKAQASKSKKGAAATMLASNGSHGGRSGKLQPSSPSDSSPRSGAGGDDSEWTAVTGKRDREKAAAAAAAAASEASKREAAATKGKGRGDGSGGSVHATPQVKQAKAVAVAAGGFGMASGPHGTKPHMAMASGRAMPPGMPPPPGMRSFDQGPYSKGAGMWGFDGVGGGGMPPAAFAPHPPINPPLPPGPPPANQPYVHQMQPPPPPPLPLVPPLPPPPLPPPLPPHPSTSFGYPSAGAVGGVPGFGWAFPQGQGVAATGVTADFWSATTGGGMGGLGAVDPWSAAAVAPPPAIPLAFGGGMGGLLSNGAVLQPPLPPMPPPLPPGPKPPPSPSKQQHGNNGTGSWANVLKGKQMEAALEGLQLDGADAAAAEAARRAVFGAMGGLDGEDVDNDPYLSSWIFTQLFQPGPNDY